ncbi:PTS sugar transporter subunit IIA [Fannyhessea vaginae]|uniref:PTS sugar transporter subunit IIA n=1 Tax=Fannyhessea vaginae TaxID=82135 RepID=UPI00288943AD|nr:PTS sugar transporter subunit IIA [Fannyhessea vaginae]
MLKYFYDNNLVYYAEKQPQDWKEAIRMSCKPLLDNHMIEPAYVDTIVQNVVDNGPYIVIVPGIAMPHALATAPGVLGTGIAFTKFEAPVTFYDPATKEEPQAQLFFTLAAKDSDEHLKNIQRLMDLLMDEEKVGQLKATHSLEDYKKLL